MINLKVSGVFLKRGMSSLPPSCLDFFWYSPLIKVNSEHTFRFPEIPLKTFCWILLKLQPTYIAVPSALFVGSSCSGADLFLFAAAPPNLLSASHCPPIFLLALFFLFLNSWFPPSASRSSPIFSSFLFFCFFSFL